jgi:hypothetical protein
MRRIALIATVVLVLTGLVGISRGNDGLAAQEEQADFSGHAFVGTWMATTPGGLALGNFAADCSVVMALQASQAGPMGVAFVSSEVGRWEPVDERTAHFTAVQILSDADGQFIGTITIDGYPVVSEDGQTITDDGSSGSVTIRDAANQVVDTITEPPTVTGVRMAVGAPGFPEETAATPSA